MSLAVREEQQVKTEETLHRHWNKLVAFSALLVSEPWHTHRCFASASVQAAPTLSDWWVGCFYNMSINTHGQQIFGTYTKWIDFAYEEEMYDRTSNTKRQWMNRCQGLPDWELMKLLLEKPGHSPTGPVSGCLELGRTELSDGWTAVRQWQDKEVLMFSQKQKS